ncbi:MAG TPA: FtsX-like permease family protein [Kofleriaceae bacterium]|nr:FtsX-like permease family protein [Kofleriaceae bacterium]
MRSDVDLVIATRRRRRIRGAIEIGLGLASIVAGIIITLATYKQVSKSTPTYLLSYGPVAAGFIVLVRGTIRVLRSEHGLAKPAEAHGTRYDLTIGLGFKSFVAWRYLMARHHRVSRVVLFVGFLGLFITVVSLVVQLTLATRANPLKLDPEQMMNFARYVKVGWTVGLVLLYFTAIVGLLRFVFSFFTTVPLVGVWIGTGALVCVLSVMSGFESDLRQKILGSNAHIQVTAEEGEMQDWKSVKARIDAIPGVIASTPYAVSEVVIASNQNGMNVIIKGIDPATVGKVTKLVSSLTDKDAMNRLEPLVDDRDDLVVPQQGAGSGAGSNVLDPPPPDMPGRGEPIDFSEGSAGPADGSDQPPPLDDMDRPPPPLDDSHAIAKGSAGGSGGGSATGSAGSAQVDDFGGDAAGMVGSAQQPVVDPPPSDLVTTDEPPTDYSGNAEDEDTIHVIDVPIDQPSLSRRTQSLPGILVGKELVKQTHLYTGEEVRVVSPLSDPSNPDATGTPIPFNRDYRVAGEFFTGMYEYDLKYVYVTLDSLQDFLDRGDAVDGIEVRIGSPDDTDAYVHRLQTVLGKQYRIQDWKELNRSLFSALKLEKIAMFLVLGIVILVASFSIVGNLIMVVVEKGREIALLKTLGASDVSLMLVFAIQGVLIGLVGTALGVGTGLLACYLGKTFGIPLNPDVYYIDRMPVHVDPESVLITAAAGVLISMAATFYPAFVAARVRPAAGMRH